MLAPANDITLSKSSRFSSKAFLTYTLILCLTMHKDSIYHRLRHTCQKCSIPWVQYCRRSDWATYASRPNAPYSPQGSLSRLPSVSILSVLGPSISAFFAVPAPAPTRTEPLPAAYWPVLLPVPTGTIPATEISNS